MRKIGIILGLLLAINFPIVESHEPYVYKPLDSSAFTRFDPEDFPEIGEFVTLPPQITPSPTLRGEWVYDPEVSWYGPGFYGNRTACGQAYTTTIMGVAHRSLPCGTLVEFRWKDKSIVVPVIDRGPYIQGRIWDLSGGLCVYLEHCFTGAIEYKILR